MGTELFDMARVRCPGTRCARDCWLVAAHQELKRSKRIQIVDSD